MLRAAQHRGVLTEPRGPLRPAWASYSPHRSGFRVPTVPEAERSFPWAGLCRRAVFHWCLSHVKSLAERKHTHNPKRSNSESQPLPPPQNVTRTELAPLRRHCLAQTHLRPRLAASRASALLSSDCRPRLSFASIL